MDYNFQFFSPLQSPASRKKRLAQKGSKLVPPVPIVPSSDVNSDSEVDHDILKIAEQVSEESMQTPPVRKRKIGSDKGTPSKRRRLSQNVDPLTSTQKSHAVSDSDEGEHNYPQTQDLFSNSDSDFERPLTPGQRSPRKGITVNGSQQSPQPSPAKPKSSLTSRDSSNSDSDGGSEYRPSPKKHSAPATKGAESSSSSESDTDNEVNTTKVTRNQPVPVLKKTPTKATNRSKYIAPEGYTEVEFASSPLTMEDLSGDKEIWILRLPSDFDVSRLTEKKFTEDSAVHLEGEGESSSNYELRSSRSQTLKTSLLLPSKSDRKLHYVGETVGQMWVSEVLDVPPVPMPELPPPRDTSLPPGLKYRNVPFGAGASKLPEFAQPDANSLPKKHKKKKKKKSKEVSLEENTTTEVDDTDVMSTQDSQAEIAPKKKKKKKKHKKERGE